MTLVVPLQSTIAPICRMESWYRVPTPQSPPGRGELRMPIGRILGVSLGAALVCAVAAGLPAVAAPLNIVAVGASNTAGWGVGPDNAYPAVLQTMLREHGYDAHVSNAGVSFSTTNGMLRRLDFVVKS